MDEQFNSKSQNKIKGSIGEAQAVSFLEENGYKILKTNYTTSIGEIDIIAQDTAGRIIFVEVKERGTAKFGYPREAVGALKQRKIRQVAQIFLKTNKKYGILIRFDVIEILAGNITHLKAAF